MGKNAEPQGPTAAETASTDIAFKQWEDVKANYLPLERKLADISQDKGLNRDREQATVAAAGNRAFADAREGIAGSATARGINPNSGAITEAIASSGDAQGRSLGTAAVGIDQDRETRRRTSGTNVIATGREVEGQSMVAYDTLGGIQQRKQIMLNESRESERAGYGRMAGQAIGLTVGQSNFGGVSDADLVAGGGSVGARNAQLQLGGGIVP